ncbi:nucleoside/nucleotide kinase family protein [Nesterenkonia sp. YGD6]|uniref:nucleoside/nucleotide kinase family protein n=1 Tax=Nesterenkonia sp. YGD6 TaxID=2901231 RepID=UPI00406CE909
MPSYVFHPGGSCLNVATGIGRLGVPTALLGRISTDHFGRLLRDHLVGSGVVDTYIQTTDDPTTVAFAHLDNGQASYSFYTEGTADRGLAAQPLRDLPDGAALHLGSISLVLEPAASTLEHLLSQESGRRLISLDPNIRPGLIPDREAYLHRLIQWAGHVDVFKLSAEDLSWLWPDRPPEDVAAELLGLGAALVVVTAGAEGARAWSRNSTVAVSAPTVDVVDTVGAGDAFTSGMLAHLHEQDALSRVRVEALSVTELTALLEHAGRVAADTCTRPGADPPRVDSAALSAEEPVLLEGGLEDLVARAQSLLGEGHRRILGITGAPGAGKSTIARRLVEILGPDKAVLVPMDGFHLSNDALKALNRRDRKGAPDTFDVAGYVDLLHRIREGGNAPIYAPDFDRDLDEPIASKIAVGPEVALVVTEGNYLLVDDGPWASVSQLLDEAWFLDLPDDERRSRLVLRHQSHGMDAETSESWTWGTDEPNAQLVRGTRSRADVTVVLQD